MCPIHGHFFTSHLVVTGFEMENKYRVCNTLGQQVYFASESECSIYCITVGMDHFGDGVGSLHVNCWTETWLAFLSALACNLWDPTLSIPLLLFVLLHLLPPPLLDSLSPSLLPLLISPSHLHFAPSSSPQLPQSSNDSAVMHIGNSPWLSATTRRRR